MNYKRIFLLLSVFCHIAVCNVAGQENADSLMFFGRVMNNLTYELIPDVKIEVLNTDSTLVDTLRSRTFLFNGEPMNISSRRKFKLPRDKQFIFRFTHEGYETTFLNYTSKAGVREYYKPISDVFMQKKMQVNLDEFVVTATKIKMVMKGDTIVYNADAFQLSSGSMLDALIALLPGVQLDGSRITVNGRFVSSLLVNGEDFFHGDAAVALKNLPVYIVDKVKVYEKAPEYEYITGHDETRELPLVVDVNLKKDYNIGWIANAEASYGTHDRWLGRLFGLRFSDHSRLALYGNVNNINDTREPGTSGDWNPSWAASGLTTMKLGGAELLLKDKKRVWKYTGNIKALREDIDDKQKASSENFLQTGNTYRRHTTGNETGRTKIMSHHTTELKLPMAMVDIRIYGELADGRSDKAFTAAEFSQPIDENYMCATLDSLKESVYKPFCAAYLLNYNNNKGIEKNRYLKGNIVTNSYITIPGTPDYVRMNISGKFNKSEYEVFSHYSLYFPNAASEEKNTFRNRYGNGPSTNYNISANAEYRHRRKIGEHSLRINLAYSYNYVYTDNLLNYYLLSRNSGWDSEENTPPLGMLPSSDEEFYRALDAQNSLCATSHKSVHIPRIEITYFFFNDKHNIKLVPKWRIQRDRLNYRRASLDTLSTRTTVAFEPSVRYGFDDFGLEYSMSIAEPSMVNLLPVRDDANPLVIREGNNGLKNTKTHKVNIYRYFWNRATQYNLSLKGHYTLYKDAVAQCLTYDATTGVRTYQPRNISGNWQAGGSVDFSRAVDKDQRFFLSTNTAATYANSADYIAIEGVTESVRSSVRNFSLSQGIQGKYSEGGNSITLKADARWNYATSNRAGFENISCVNFNYGIYANWKLPLKLHIATDLTVYSRRGYNDAQMNTNDVVWNARVERAFLSGGNLVVAMEGFDILGQLSNVQRTLNAQGMVETLYNTIPRYAMLRVIYRLNVEPKKKL